MGDSTEAASNRGCCAIGPEHCIHVFSIKQTYCTITITILSTSPQCSAVSRVNITMHTGTHCYTNIETSKWIT